MRIIFNLYVRWKIMVVSTSILSIRENIEQKLEQLNQTDTDYIHLDVMDGKFVKNQTRDYVPLKNHIKKPIDLHLMVEDVPTYFEHYQQMHPEIVTFHVEVNTNVEKLIHRIKEKKMKVGISLKPSTPVTFLFPYLEEIDLILVMSVGPGAGGQMFLPSIVSKIELLKRIREERGYHYLIEVDGGINAETKKFCKEADILVSGSFITNQEDYQKQIDQLR